MLSGIRQKVTVQSGGVIQVQSSELPIGAEVEVIVLLDTPAGEGRPLVSFIGAAQGSFANPTEADQFIRQHRDAWES